MQQLMAKLQFSLEVFFFKNTRLPGQRYVRKQIGIIDIVC